MDGWLEMLMWSCAAMVVLITLGYPLFLVMTAPLGRRRRMLDDAEPAVTLVIAAYNEQSCIAAKLENALALDYPRDRLEIVVASDGSTDRTHELVAAYLPRGVLLRAYPRSGKTGIQNAAVREAHGEILVFSDANAMYRPDAIRKLVRNFADPTVACVCGQLVYRAGEGGAGHGENSYWNYEKFIKQRESDLSSLIGANGSIYAVRRSCYVALDPGVISDLVEPLALVARGHRVVYEPEAVSVEEASASYRMEFRRKVRILTRSIRGILHMRELFNPLRYGVFTLQLVMHKLLRYLVPAFLLLGALALTALAARGHYRPLFLLAAVAVALALSAGSREREGRRPLPLRVLHLLYYYLLVNWALVLAWTNIVRGRGMVVWAPERPGAQG